MLRFCISYWRYLTPAESSIFLDAFVSSVSPYLSLIFCCGSQMLFFDFTSPQTLKYGSMSAVFGFLKYKNYSFVGSKKFLPSDFL